MSMYACMHVDVCVSMYVCLSMSACMHVDVRMSIHACRSDDGVVVVLKNLMGVPFILLV